MFMYRQVSDKKTPKKIYKVTSEFILIIHTSVFVFVTIVNMYVSQKSQISLIPAIDNFPFVPLLSFYHGSTAITRQGPSF